MRQNLSETHKALHALFYSKDAETFSLLLIVISWLGFIAKNIVKYEINQIRG